MSDNNGITPEKIEYIKKHIGNKSNLEKYMNKSKRSKKSI